MPPPMIAISISVLGTGLSLSFRVPYENLDDLNNHVFVRRKDRYHAIVVSV